MKLNIMKKLTEFFMKISEKIAIRFGQYPNGMHWAEIKENGSVVSATVKLTSFEIQKWISEHNI